MKNFRKMLYKELRFLCSWCGGKIEEEKVYTIFLVPKKPDETDCSDLWGEYIPYNISGKVVPALVLARGVCEELPPGTDGLMITTCSEKCDSNLKTVLLVEDWEIVPRA